MRTVSASELARLSKDRGARVQSAAPPPMQQPVVQVNNDKLADAVLQLGSLLAGAMQSFRMPATPAEPMPTMAPQPAAAPVIEYVDRQPELVQEIGIRTDRDGLLAEATTAEASYRVVRDEDGMATAIVRNAGGVSSTYQVVRAGRGKITSIRLA